MRIRIVKIYPCIYIYIQVCHVYIHISTQYTPRHPNGSPKPLLKKIFSQLEYESSNNKVPRRELILGKVDQTLSPCLFFERLPSLKLTFSPLKIGLPNRKVVQYSNHPFSGAFAVSFRECMCLKLPHRLREWYDILFHLGKL